MKIVNFKKYNVEKIGIKTKQGILDVSKAAKLLNLSTIQNMNELFYDSQSGLEQLATLQQKVNEQQLTNVYLNEEEVHFLPVVTNPDKMITVNYNYLLHASKQIGNIPTSLSFGGKFNNSLAAHNQSIPLPAFAEQYDYGAELVIVIGKAAKHVSKEEALEYVFGYSIGNDLSARDLQEATQSALVGKVLDYFAPVGPYLVTNDEVNPDELEIELRLNNKVLQSNNTKNMLFNCAEIISVLSQYMSLAPGDLIFTGTPGGVLEERNSFSPKRWITSEDTIEVTISGLGTLKNTFY